MQRVQATLGSWPERISRQEPRALGAELAFHHWNVTVRAPIAKLGAESPEFIVLLAVSDWHTHMFPAVDASSNAKCVIVPQFPVGAGNVIAALFEVWPPVPLDAVVLPALCVPAQFARLDVTATRA